MAALSSYENRAISTGVLLLGTAEDPAGPRPPRPPGAHHYSQALTGVKSFFRLVDGLRTLFLLSRDGMLLDIIDVRQWADRAFGTRALTAPCSAPYAAHALATSGDGHVCLVLSPSHEIKVFARGAQVLAYRHAQWTFSTCSGSTRSGPRRSGTPTSHAACSDRRSTSRTRDRARSSSSCGRPPTGVAIISLPDRLDIGLTEAGNMAAAPTRRDLLYLLTGRTVTDLEPTVLAALASLDGATVRIGRAT